MRIAVINLHDAVDRRQNVLQVLKGTNHSMGFFQAHRFNSPLNDIFSFDKQELDEVYSFKLLFGSTRPLSQGEVGCASSHVSLCKMFLESDMEWICILEDDIVIPNLKLFDDVLARIENKEWDGDLFYLGALRRTKLKSRLDRVLILIKSIIRILLALPKLWRCPTSFLEFTFQSVRESNINPSPTQNFWCEAGMHDGTHGYVINRRAAMEIIRWNESLIFRSDELLSFLTFRRCIDSFVKLPEIVFQNVTFESQIGNNIQSRTE